MANLPKAEWIWMDGDFVRWRDANVHVLTHTLHYGLGVFEGTRAYHQVDGSTAIFRLDDHIRRLQRSAHILALQLPYNQATLCRATVDLVRNNNLESCYIRHLVFVGDGAMGLYANNPVRTAIIAWPWGTYLGDDALSDGIRCKIASYVRAHPNSALNMAKCTANYVNSILAKREAVSHGYNEALLLDTEGFIAEGSGENIFVVRNGKLKTPPFGAALEGITRDTVMRIATDMGLTVVEQRIPRDELYVADEVFLTGTAAEITPVREVDGRTIGSGKPGPVTTAIQKAYFANVRGEAVLDAAWLTSCGTIQAAVGA